MKLSLPVFIDATENLTHQLPRVLNLEGRWVCFATIEIAETLLASECDSNQKLIRQLACRDGEDFKETC